MRRNGVLVDATPLQTEHRYRGIGTYTAGLLDALTRLQGGERLDLLAQRPHADDAPLLADLLARPGVGTVRLRRPRRPRYRLHGLLSPLVVGPAVRGSGARVYHATDPNGVVRTPGVATVATLYDLIPLYHPGEHFPLRRLDQRAAYARYLRLARRVDRLIAISEATKRDAVERLRIAPERIVVTPLAVDERRFYLRTEGEIDDIVARYGLKRPYFLHVGASAYHKNTANILRAFDLFRRAGAADHALYIAGKWNAAPLAALQASYGDLVASGRLRVLGFVPDDDLPALYGGADALVYPSLIEGFGLPVLEAMRCGAPVLTSTTSSLPEAAGDAALLVAPRDVERIAAALERLAGEPALRADLRARGLKRAALFSWARTARETWGVYQDLA